MEAIVIPKGLGIDLEPSIGNYDEAFCEKWYKRLHEFSLILMKDVIEHSEQVETATAAKITTDMADLKKTLPIDSHKDVFDQMSENADRRRQRLAVTKKKKLTYLRYNRPERENDRRETQRRPERQRYPDDRESRTSSNRRNDNFARRDDREHEKYRRPTGRDHEDDHRWDERQQQRTNLEGRRSRRDLAGHYNAPRNRREEHQSDDDQPGRHQNNTRYRDILRGSRPNSRTSILKRASATNLSRRNSNTDTRPREDPKDVEIHRLREQLNRRDTEGAKNDKRPVIPEPPNVEGAPPDNKQVLEFIATTMKALEAFKIQLAN